MKDLLEKLKKMFAKCFLRKEKYNGKIYIIYRSE